MIFIASKTLTEAQIEFLNSQQQYWKNKYTIQENTSSDVSNKYKDPLSMGFYPVLKLKEIGKRSNKPMNNHFSEEWETYDKYVENNKKIVAENDLGRILFRTIENQDEKELQELSCSMFLNIQDFQQPESFSKNVLNVIQKAFNISSEYFNTKDETFPTNMFNDLYNKFIVELLPEMHKKIEQYQKPFVDHSFYYHNSEEDLYKELDGTENKITITLNNKELECIKRVSLLNHVNNILHQDSFNDPKENFIYFNLRIIGEEYDRYQSYNEKFYKEYEFFFKKDIEDNLEKAKKIAQKKMFFLKIVYVLTFMFIINNFLNSSDDIKVNLPQITLNGTEL